MSKNNIHPMAIVEPGAVIGENVTVEAYAVVKSTVTLKDNVVIKSHAYIDGHTTIGEKTVIWPSAVIGTKAQAIRFRGEKTFVNIGKQCEIRECVTINSSTLENSSVEVGDGCFIMAYCHIAHNCSLGKRVIMSNSATLAGFVTVEDGAIIGGFTPLPQHSRIGAYAMVGGMSRVPHDVPPYTIGGGIPYKLGGLNLIGLKRNGFSYETRKTLSQAFKLMYRSGLHLEEALVRIKEELPPIPEITHWLEFCNGSKRGIMGFQGVSEDFEENGDMLEE